MGHSGVLGGGEKDRETIFFDPTIEMRVFAQKGIGGESSSVSGVSIKQEPIRSTR